MGIFDRFKKHEKGTDEEFWEKMVGVPGSYQEPADNVADVDLQIPDEEMEMLLGGMNGPIQEDNHMVSVDDIDKRLHETDTAETPVWLQKLHKAQKIREDAAAQRKAQIQNEEWVTANEFDQIVQNPAAEAAAARSEELVKAAQLKDQIQNEEWVTADKFDEIAKNDRTM